MKITYYLSKINIGNTHCDKTDSFQYNSERGDHLIMMKDSIVHHKHSRLIIQISLYSSKSNFEPLKLIYILKIMGKTAPRSGAGGVNLDTATLRGVMAKCTV